MRMLLDTNLIFRIIVGVFAESALGFVSFRGRVVGRSELFTCSRVPSLGSLFFDLFMKIILSSKRAKYPHPFCFCETTILLVNGRSFILDLLIRLSGIPHVFDVWIEIIHLPLELFEESFARLVRILRATNLEKTGGLIHFWLPLVGLFCDHRLLFVVWVQTPASSLIIEFATAVLSALLSTPTLAHISNLTRCSVPLLT